MWELWVCMCRCNHSDVSLWASAVFMLMMHMLLWKNYIKLKTTGRFIVRVVITPMVWPMHGSFLMIQTLKATNLSQKIAADLQYELCMVSIKGMWVCIHGCMVQIWIEVDPCAGQSTLLPPPYTHSCLTRSILSEITVLWSCNHSPCHHSSRWDEPFKC